VSETKRILLTGSAGSIGRCIGPALAGRGHAVRGFDLSPTADLPDAVVGDLTDRPAVDRAMADRDTLIHLAAYPLANGDFLDDILQPNVVGLHHVLESAVAAGVRRIILASTMQVISGLARPRPEPITVDAGVAPTNYYALTKVWAEHYAEMLARLHAATAFAVRIGWFPRNTEEMRRIVRTGAQRSFLSHDDTRRFFIAAVEAPDPDPPFAVLFATSRDTNVDLEPARRLIGYDPGDVFPHGCPFDPPDQDD